MSQPTVDDAQRGVVVLVHGILTSAKWQTQVRDRLQSEGFAVEIVRIGRVSLPRFIQPFWSFKRKFYKYLETGLNSARANYSSDKIFVVAHSFGTYLLGKFLENNPEYRLSRAILCGSLLKEGETLRQYRGQFRSAGDSKKETSPSIVSDRGSHDIWPVIAKKINSQYGASGSLGSAGDQGFYYDRCHQGFAHSDFLTVSFCNDYWVPFFRDGRVITPPSGVSHGHSWLVGIIDKLPVRTLLVAALFVGFIFAYYVLISTSNYFNFDRDYRSSAAVSAISTDISSDRIYASGATLVAIIRNIRSHCDRRSQWFMPFDDRCLVAEVPNFSELMPLYTRYPFVCLACTPFEALLHFGREHRECFDVAVEATGYRIQVRSSAFLPRGERRICSR